MLTMFIVAGEIGIATSVVDSTGSGVQSAGANTADLLHVYNARIQNALGQNVTLTGVGYGDYTALFNSGNATADAINIRNHGFNTVELVIEWGGLMTSRDAFNTTYEGIIQTRVNALGRQGLYIIIKMNADCNWTVLACNHLEKILGSTQYCLKTSVDLTSTFYATPISNSTSGVAQLKEAWLTISGLFPSNGNVIGYDILNEPFYCGSGPYSPIRSEWHTRADELVSFLRRDGDTRIIFLQEAPENLYFGDPCCGVYYTNRDINFTNYVATAHFYQGENSGYPWSACTGSYSVIFGLWNGTNYTGACEHTTAIWAFAAQKKFSNQAFFLGEYGSIWANRPGDIDQSWNINATRAFYTSGVVGWIYETHDTTGTWEQDVRPVVTVKAPSITIIPGKSTLGSFQVIDNQSFVGTLTYSYSSNIPGLAATLSPSTAFFNIRNTASAQYTITGSGSTAPGSYSILWKATLGSLTFTSTATVTVESQSVGGTLFPVDKIALLLQFSPIASITLILIATGTILLARSKNWNRGRLDTD